MIGLLGTVIGMIRSFRALANGGQASSACSFPSVFPRLDQHRWRLIAAIIAIVAYNFFTNKVDSFVYTIEEATVSVVELISAQSRA